MFPFPTHLYLPATMLSDPELLLTDSATLAAGIAIELERNDGVDALKAYRAILDSRGWPLRAVGLQWDVRRPPDANLINDGLATIGDACDLLLLRLCSSDAHDKPSAPRALAVAAEFIHRCLRQTDSKIRIALTPQVGLWLSNEQDAVRLAMRVNRANVGVAMNWNQCSTNAATFADTLRLVHPKLLAVMLEPGNEMVERLILPHLDMQPLISLGYRGPVFLRINL